MPYNVRYYVPQYAYNIISISKREPPELVESEANVQCLNIARLDIESEDYIVTVWLVYGTSLYTTVRNGIIIFKFFTNLPRVTAVVNRCS